MTKLTQAIAGFSGVAGVIAFIVLLLCLIPILFLWSLNSLFELAGTDLYIAHSIWSYWVALIFLGTVRGSCSK